MHKGARRSNVSTPYQFDGDLVIVSDQRMNNSPLPLVFVAPVSPQTNETDLRACRHLGKARLIQPVLPNPPNLDQHISNFLIGVWEASVHACFSRASFCDVTCTNDACKGKCDDASHGEYRGKKSVIVIGVHQATRYVLVAPIGSDGMEEPRNGVGDIVLQQTDYLTCKWFTEEISYVKVVNAAWIPASQVIGGVTGVPKPQDITRVVQRFHAIFDQRKYIVD